MSLFGSLFTGVSALSAQSSSLSMISNNIANANTIGYKDVYADFSSLVTDSGTSGDYSSGGVLANTINTTADQGSLEQTSSPTDIAVSGSGFFVVRAEPSDTSPVMYTRSGSFTENENGYLVNTSGNVLYAWPLDANGNIPASDQSLESLVPVNVSLLGGKTEPTSSATLAMNLNSAQTVDHATDFSRSITVYDSQGGAETLNVNFSKTASNTWNMSVTDNATPPNPLLPENLPATVPPTYTVPVTFNADGSIDTVNGVAATTPFSVAGTAGTGINWGNGTSTSQTIALDLSGVTQYNSSYNVTSITQNGASLGTRTGVEIDSNGIVSATFSNGTTANLYQIPLATFANPDGLESQNGNAYTSTDSSGDYNLAVANTSGAGSISSDALESSNVDIADEYSKMIVTERSYSAASKIISTVDQMLQTLEQVVH